MENSDISKALEVINEKMREAKSRRPPSMTHEVYLVAVSKTKPKEMIIEAYKHGQRHFGENYVNELFEKASDPEILEKCPDIKWHYIGHLQSNKINKLLAVPNLYMLQTVDSMKLIDAVDKAWAKTLKKYKLKIMIQVNASEEESKSGVSLQEVIQLTQHVVENCSHCTLIGYMVIGYAYHDLKKGANPEFQFLLKCKESACEMFKFKPDELGLSMGMSDDFEHAIEVGSTFVRIGSSIFGSRISKD